ncbi:MAG: hypothetical protein AAGF93_24315 [Cyanobacteria bacterium P01_H01_bin.105]
MATRWINTQSMGWELLSHPLRFAMHLCGGLGLGSGFPFVPSVLGAVLSMETRTMFQEFDQGAAASTVQSDHLPDYLPDYQYETVRLLALGSLTVVRLTIQELHTKHYAEPNDWSRPLPTGRPNEVMAILTKRVRVA